MPRIDHPVIDTAETVAWKGPLAGIDHTVIRVPDMEVGLEWYQRLLGLVVSERVDNRVFLASPVTGRVIFGLSEGGTGLDYVSFRARTAESFESVAAALDKAGVSTSTSSKGQRSGVLNSLEFTTPTGHTMQIVHREPDAPTAPVAGEYRPGALDVRTGHLQLRTTDVKEMTDFLGLIGFRSSSYVPLPDSDGYFLQFLRANDLHHQVAVLTGERGFHHVALELDEADVWRLLDHLAVTKQPIEYGPIRHHEGHLLSFYIRDPFKNRLEINGPMGFVGFDYPAESAKHEFWYHMNMWGPQPPESWLQEWMES